MAKQDDFIRTALRVPPDLHARLHEAAAANERTFNAEIIARLLETFDERTVAPVDLLQLELVLARLWNRRNAVQLQQVHAFDQRTAAREARDRAAAEGDQEAVRDLENQMEMMLKTIGRYDLELQRIDKELLQAEADLAKASSEEMRHVPK